MDSGQAKIVYRHYAVLGSESRTIAEGSECAGEQGAFWEYHDHAFQDRSGGRGIEGQIARAETLGLDVPQFTACMENAIHESTVASDLEQAREDGVTTQPTIFVVSGDQATKFVGARSFDEVSAVIDEYLGSQY